MGSANCRVDMRNIKTRTSRQLSLIHADCDASPLSPPTHPKAIATARSAASFASALSSIGTTQSMFSVIPIRPPCVG